MKNYYIFLLIALMPSFVFANEINIYTTRQPALLIPLLDDFEEKTNIKVNVGYFNNGLRERMKAEGRRSKADVILTTDVIRLVELAENGLTQAFISPTVSKVPEHLKDANNQWIGLTTRARVIFASKTRVEETDISYDDLGNPKWQGRICFRSGTDSYNLTLITSMISNYGEIATEEWLKKIKSNLARKPQGNDRAQVKAIWAGECDIALGNTYYMGQMLEDKEQVEWANSVKIIFPTFLKSDKTHINVSGMALSKHSPNKENAVKFMEYLLSHDAQEIYSAINYEYPIVKDVELNPIVEGWGDFIGDDLNVVELAKIRSQALRLVERVDFDN